MIRWSFWRAVRFSISYDNCTPENPGVKENKGIAPLQSKFLILLSHVRRHNTLLICPVQSGFPVLDSEIFTRRRQICHLYILACNFTKFNAFSKCWNVDVLLVCWHSLVRTFTDFSNTYSNFCGYSIAFQLGTDQSADLSSSIRDIK